MGKPCRAVPLWNLSRKPGATGCLLDGDLCGTPEFSVLLWLSLQVSRAMRDFPIVVWAMAVVMEV